MHASIPTQTQAFRLQYIYFFSSESFDIYVKSQTEFFFIFDSEMYAHTHILPINLSYTHTIFFSYTYRYTLSFSHTYAVTKKQK